MGKKRQGANASSGGGKSPNWLPYLALLGVALAIAAFFTVGSSDSKPTPRSRAASTAQLEEELRRMHAGLAAVAGRGKSSIFSKIQTMADQAQNVLAKADAAENEDEKKRILEDGLRSKSDWLMTLQEHAVGLKKDEAEDEFRSDPSSTGVTVLSAGNFSNYLASNPRTMVEFYAPWCPHCQKFAPEFAACSVDFKGRAAFAIVNGEKETQLSRIYGVGGYPTLKWMVYGRAVDYEGLRTRERLSKWIEDRLQPAYVELESIDDVASALQQGGNSKAKICSGEGIKDSRIYKAFVAAAEHYRGKLVFTWSPMASEGGEGKIRFHATGSDAQVCGSDTEGSESNASSCNDPDSVIAWLDDKLSFDPDLQ